MRAGTLRDKITIQTSDTSAGLKWDALGAQWADLCSVWASVKPVTAREQLRAGGIDSETNYVIRLRYRPDVNDQCRILFRGQVLNVVGVVDVDGRRRELEITATQHKQEVADV